MQSHRLVLIHFWAPWCGPCRALEGNVFSQPGVGPALESRFVPVKINLDDHAYSATSRLYEIQSIPTDEIVTPSGRLIAKIPSPQDPRLYVAQLMRAADNGSPRMMASAGPPPAYTPAPPTYSNSNLASYSNPADALPGPAEPAPPAYGPSAYGPPAYTPAPQAYSPAPSPPQNAATASAYSVPPNPTPDPQSTAQQPATPPAPQYSAPPARPAQYPIGLDGYCPVTLVERHHITPSDPSCWVHGDRRWGIEHRGTVFLFAGPEEQKRFLADPDRYSPALSGNDPVLAFDEHRLVQGTRQFGVFFGDRIYLFSSAENLAKFRQSPQATQRYAEEVRQAEANSRATMH